MITKDNTAGVLREVDRKVSQGLSEIAPAVETLAKQTVVVVSGDLQRSITTEISDNEVRIGSPLKYAPKIEMDKPFLRVALEGTMAKIRRVFKI